MSEIIYLPSKSLAEATEKVQDHLDRSLEVCEVLILQHRYLDKENRDIPPFTELNDLEYIFLKQACSITEPIPNQPYHRRISIPNVLYLSDYYKIDDKRACDLILSISKPVSQLPPSFNGMMG